MSVRKPLWCPVVQSAGGEATVRVVEACYEAFNVATNDTRAAAPTEEPATDSDGFPASAAVSAPVAAADNWKMACTVLRTAENTVAAATSPDGGGGRRKHEG